MDKEYLKEIIKMFLNREKQNYLIISEMNIKREVKEEAIKIVKTIDKLINHLEEDYEVVLEILAKNINENKKI